MRRFATLGLLPLSVALCQISAAAQGCVAAEHFSLFTIAPIGTVTGQTCLSNMAIFLSGSLERITE